MPLFFSGMVIVIAFDGEGAKEALHLEVFPAFSLFSRFGLVSGVGAIRRRLEQPPHSGWRA